MMWSQGYIAISHVHSISDQKVILHMICHRLYYFTSYKKYEKKEISHPDLISTSVARLQRTTFDWLCYWFYLPTFSISLSLSFIQLTVLFSLNSLRLIFSFTFLFDITLSKYWCLFFFTQSKPGHKWPDRDFFTHFEVVVIVFYNLKDLFNILLGIFSENDAVHSQIECIENECVETNEAFYDTNLIYWQKDPTIIFIIAFAIKPCYKTMRKQKQQQK